MQPVNRFEFLKFYCNEINNDTAKRAFVTNKVTFFYSKNILNCSGIYMEEILTKTAMGFTTYRNEILHQLIEDVLQHTVPAGIPQQMYEKTDNFIFEINHEVKNNDPKVLTLKDLAFGFNIVLIALGISCAVFIFECTFFAVKKFVGKNVKRFIGNSLVLMLVQQWLEKYHV
jgi:hypothetical protein